MTEFLKKFWDFFWDARLWQKVVAMLIVTAVVSLASYLFYCFNRYCVDSVDKTNLTIKIDAPKDGDTIGPSYNAMHGTFDGDIPKNSELWVLARNENQIFVIPPGTVIDITNKRWTQTNIKLQPAEYWELSVCLANDTASKSFRDKFSRKNWDGFDKLPEGVKIYQSVKIKLKK